MTADEKRSALKQRWKPGDSAQAAERLGVTRQTLSIFLSRGAKKPATAKKYLSAIEKVILEREKAETNF